MMMQPPAGPFVQPGVRYPMPNGRYIEELPSDAGFDYEDTPLDRLLQHAARKSYARLEYLQWEFEEPGPALLGSPILGIQDPRMPFEIFDPTRDPGAELLGTARVMDLSQITLKDTNGIRGTIGIPTNYFTVEGRIFTFEKSTDFTSPTELPSISAPPTTPGEATLIGTSTLVNGQIGNNVFLYDNSFRADFSSELWGAEANFIMNESVDGEGLKIKPLAGFRFLSLDERLVQTGVFDNFGTIPAVTSVIDADAQNYIYSPHIGVRGEFVHRWFTIGVEPKIGPGWNRHEVAVATSNLRGPGDPIVRTIQQGTDFTAVFELGLYARVHVTDFLSLHVGYDLLMASEVARPHNSILYNDNGPLPALPAVVARPELEDIRFQGLSVGGQIQLP